MDELHWARNQKLSMLSRWAGMLKKLIDPIRQQDAKKALQQLKKKSYMKLEDSDDDVMKLR